MQGRPFLTWSYSGISGMPRTECISSEDSPPYVGFDLPAGTFVRAANVSRTAHANDERGLHPLWHLSAQNLHFLTLSICPSHFTVGQFITMWYLQSALQPLAKYFFRIIAIFSHFDSNLATSNSLSTIVGKSDIINFIFSNNKKYFKVVNWW